MKPPSAPYINQCYSRKNASEQMRQLRALVEWSAKGQSIGNWIEVASDSDKAELWKKFVQIGQALEFLADLYLWDWDESCKDFQELRQQGEFEIVENKLVFVFKRIANPEWLRLAPSIPVVDLESPSLDILLSVMRPLNEKRRKRSNWKS